MVKFSLGVWTHNPLIFNKKAGGILLSFPYMGWSWPPTVRELVGGFKDFLFFAPKIGEDESSHFGRNMFPNELNQLMVNYVVWIPRIPLWKGLLLRGTLNETKPPHREKWVATTPQSTQERAAEQHEQVRTDSGIGVWNHLTTYPPVKVLRFIEGKMLRENGPLAV